MIELFKLDILTLIRGSCCCATNNIRLSWSARNKAEGSAPDNIRTTVNNGSGSSKYGLIVKTASTEYGRVLVGTVRLFR